MVSSVLLFFSLLPQGTIFRKHCSLSRIFCLLFCKSWTDDHIINQKNDVMDLHLSYPSKSQKAIDFQMIMIIINNFFDNNNNNVHLKLATLTFSAEERRWELLLLAAHLGRPRTLPNFLLISDAFKASAAFSCEGLLHPIDSIAASFVLSSLQSSPIANWNCCELGHITKTEIL